MLSSVWAIVSSGTHGFVAALATAGVVEDVAHLEMSVDGTGGYNEECAYVETDLVRCCFVKSRGVVGLIEIMLPGRHLDVRGVWQPHVL